MLSVYTKMVAMCTIHSRRCTLPLRVINRRGTRVIPAFKHQEVSGEADSSGICIQNSDLNLNYPLEQGAWIGLQRVICPTICCGGTELCNYESKILPWEVIVFHNGLRIININYGQTLLEQRLRFSETSVNLPNTSPRIQSRYRIKTSR